MLIFLKKSSIFVKTGKSKKYPKVIQLPITYKCNSKCVMCNIWKMDSSHEASLEEFSQFMKDPIFKEVKAVGINGGEPTLIKNLPAYAEEVLKLPNLRSLNVISNGFNKNKLLEDLQNIYEKCRKKQIKFHVSISLDGVGEIHDKVRGKKGSFDKVIATIDEIKDNKRYYCDSFDLGCTVVRQNVDYLQELDVFVDSKQLPIKYRLGVPNKRIQSDEILDNYSVLADENKQSAKEFFHYQMNKANRIQEKFKYFSIFTWLDSNNPKRFMGCAWKDEGITLDSRGNLYYCAVASKSIGSLRSENGKDVFFASNNIKYRANLVKEQCDQCIHDYSGKTDISNVIKFLKMLVSKKLAMKTYKLRCSFKS